MWHGYETNILPHRRMIPSISPATSYLPGNKLPQGPWGRVRYLNEQVPYSTEISIAPNDSKEPREFEFQFGMAYTITVIHVTQQGSTE